MWRASDPFGQAESGSRPAEVGALGHAILLGILKILMSTKTKPSAGSRPAPSEPPMAKAGTKNSLSIRDNRTGRDYEVPILDGEVINAMDLRQIKVNEEDFGM